MADNQSTQDSEFRGKLAQRLTSVALACVGGLAVAIIIGAALNALIQPTPEKTKDFFEIAKYLMATVLPVVSAWVGTVLAFYFGKENFEAATRSVTSAARALSSKEKLASTAVTDLGIARSKFTALVLTEDESKAPDQFKLDRIDSAFAPVPPQDKPYERLPVLLAGDLPYMVLHRSTLNSVIVDALKKDPNTNTGKLTLADLFQHVDYLPAKSFVVVSPSATAAQAKVELESVKNCSDVFVTSDGTKKTAVTRWITNVDLLKASEV